MRVLCVYARVCVIVGANVLGSWLQVCVWCVHASACKAVVSLLCSPATAVLFALFGQIVFLAPLLTELFRCFPLL